MIDHAEARIHHERGRYGEHVIHASTFVVAVDRIAVAP